MTLKKWIKCFVSITTAFVIAMISSTSLHISAFDPEANLNVFYKHRCHSSTNKYTLPTLTTIENTASTYSVIGDDTRERDYDETVVSITGGTGFIIGAHTIATAGHCIYSGNKYENKFKDNIKIRIINENDQIVEELTPKFFNIPYNFYEMYDGTTESYQKACNYDYGMIEVAEDLSEYGCFSLGIAMDNIVTGNPNLEVCVSGFPASALGTSADGKRFLGKGNITDINDKCIFYNADMSNGMSGGPVYSTYTSSYNLTYDTVIGINIASSDNNIGIRITPLILQFYLNNPYKVYDKP